jgi:dGTPase
MENPLFTFDEDERAYLREGLATADRMLSPYAAHDADAVYEHMQKGDYDVDLVRPPFVRDVDRILNNAFYNRCMDKTQVFPFFRNDDLTRRSFHLQLVSQTARKIGTALRLNTGLIEAIALGHDMGHTPFGHAGEHVLSDIYHAHTGRYFNHNVQSVRLLRTVAGRDLSLQTLNGMLCHCGEKAFEEYHPGACDTFSQLDEMMERCYTLPGASSGLHPNTLEGCVVRICDILAYLGKDRQDALGVGVLSKDRYWMQDNILGRANWEFIQNAAANIVKNSIERDCLAMDPAVLEAILAIKDENARDIYASPQAHATFDRYIAPMMVRVYDQLLDDVETGNTSSYIFKHYLNAWMLASNDDYGNESPNDIVVDYIASMTDEYFIDFCNYLYPEDAMSEDQLYVPYF